MIFKVALWLAAVIGQVLAHGRFLEPPSRSSMWRVMEGDPLIEPYASIVEANYNDNELFCGGFSVSLDGKCGICGDPYDGERENEAGGKYGKGIIVRQYTPGSLIEVQVQLTAHHLGFFEFRLCEWNSPSVPANQTCLNRNLLQFEDGGTQYFPPTQGGGPWMFNPKVWLPAGLTCTQCVLQWRYHAGNSWDCDADGECCQGCGNQEEFYGCADIAIGSGPVLPPPDWNDPPPAPTSASTTTISTEAGTSTTTLPPQTTTTISDVSVSPGTNDCSVLGAGMHMASCTEFFTCSGDGSGPYEYDCPPGTVYDEFRQLCDYPSNVPPECGTKVVG